MAAGSITAIEKPSIFGTKLRWAICGLLFFATTVNYVDRQVLGILKPVLQHDLGWTEANYGWVVFTFQLAYGLMMPFAGRAMDWLGTRLGYALAVTVWSAASMLHALASTPFSLPCAASAWASARRPISPPPLRPWPTGFHAASALRHWHLQQRIEYRSRRRAPRRAPRRGPFRLAHVLHLHR